MANTSDQYAEEYFFDHYESLMRLYSVLFTDYEVSQQNIDSDPIKINHRVCELTVVSHFILNNCPRSNIIAAYIKSNKYKPICHRFHNKLIELIRAESLLNEFERQGKIKLTENSPNRKIIIIDEEGNSTELP